MSFAYKISIVRNVFGKSKTARVHPFIHNVEKRPSILKKILRYSHRKIFKACLAIFQHYEWKD